MRQAWRPSGITFFVPPPPPAIKSHLRYSLAARLPPEMWNEAITFFSSRPESPAPLLQGVEPPTLANRIESEMGGSQGGAVDI